MKQYMPLMPVKRGLVWVRADAVSGYFCDFDIIYIGRPSDGATTEVGLGERVVLQLSECLRGQHYQLYFDNFFTCRLLDILHSQHLYSCGTARYTRREFPESLRSVAPERGEYRFCQRVLLWRLSGRTTNQ